MIEAVASVAKAAVAFGTVLTNNLINGMALGTLSYLALEIAMGRRSAIPAMVWGLGVVFIAYAIVIAQIFLSRSMPPDPTAGTIPAPEPCVQPRSTRARRPPSRQGRA